MGGSPTSASIGRLPSVLAATFAVVGAPILVVSLLRASETVVSFVLLAAIGTGLSVAAAAAGAALWSKRAAGGDTVFDDLMLWGWLRRRRQERLLASAERLLGSLGAAGADRATTPSLGRRVGLLKRLAGALESRDPYTHGHSRRVARHAAATAKRMGLPREQVARIRTAASVHDIGKLETPTEIVRKPGRLSEEEFAVVKRHAAAGAELVGGLGDEELTRIVRHHHERIDGNGYPDGLAGDRIPIGARIVAVADTFDAVTSTRPYRAARRHREALELLSAEAGAQLDPDAVRAFRAYYSGLRPTALSALALNGPRQLFASLADQLRLGGATVAAKGAAVTAVALGVGSVAVHSPQANGDPAGGARSAAAQRAPAGPAWTGKRAGGKGAKARLGRGGGAGPRAGGAQPRSRATGGGEARPASRSAGGDGPGGGSGSKAGAAPTREGGPSSVESRPDDSSTTARVTDSVAEVESDLNAVVDAVESAAADILPAPLPDLRVKAPNTSSLDLGG